MSFAPFTNSSFGRSPWPVFLLVITAVIGFDQASKALAARAGLTRLNTGGSLGLGAQLDTAIWVVVTLAITGWLLWQLHGLGRRSPRRRHQASYLANRFRIEPLGLGLTLLIGGGLANLIDRLLFGAVRDWLPVPVLNLANNLADWAIAGGLLIVLWFSWTVGQSSDQVNKSSEQTTNHT